MAVDLKQVGTTYKTTQEAIDAGAGKYQDRVLAQPESAKGPVGLPLQPHPVPYRLKGA